MTNPPSPALPALAPDPGSFRDPRSRVYRHGNEVIRLLDERGAADFAAFEATPLFSRAQADGRVVRTRRRPLPPGVDERWHAALEHDRVPVVSYPYEWSFSMLQDAALLHLDLVAEALPHGLTSKDGSSFNVQFVRGRPVFIDVGSFQPVGDDPWPGHRQFGELLLHPLLIEAHLGVPFAPFLRGSLDGIPAATASSLLRGTARFKRGVLANVTARALVADRYARRDDPAGAVLGDPASATDVMTAVVRKTTELVGRLATRTRETAWTDYQDRDHYVDGSLAAKDAVVRAAVEAAGPGTVVDLGCNDGRYARMAARAGRNVVAVDADREVIDGLYRSVRASGEAILPLVADLADPSPALGWRLAERSPFAARVDADLVLALALIHHLVIGRNLPIDEVLASLAALAPVVVLEVPHRDDPMVQRLLAHKAAGLHADYEVGTIEAMIERHFRIDERIELPGDTRTIFRLRRRETASV